MFRIRQVCTDGQDWGEATLVWKPSAWIVLPGAATKNVISSRGPLSMWAQGQVMLCQTPHPSPTVSRS